MATLPSFLLPVLIAGAAPFGGQAVPTASSRQPAIERNAQDPAESVVDANDLFKTAN
jgi:hypothetical protein